MGNLLKKTRIEQGMTQTELSEKSGVSRITISALENGTQRSTMTGTLQKLAAALGKTISDIFFPESV